MLIAHCRGSARPLLSDEMRAFLLHGPSSKRDRDTIRHGGAATVLVQWRRHRDELMAAATPMGRRPWGYWLIEQGLKHQPAGEAGELRIR